MQVTLDSSIKKGSRYSIRCRLLFAHPYPSLKTFEPTVGFVISSVKKAFPALSYFSVAYASVYDRVPDIVDLIFSFSQDPGMTLKEFAYRVKDIATKQDWTLLPMEVLWHEEGFPWWLLLLGFIAYAAQK